MTTAPITTKVTMLNSVMAPPTRSAATEDRDGERDERKPTNGKPPFAPGEASTNTEVLPFDFASLSKQVLAAVLAGAQRETELRLEQERNAALETLREHALVAEMLGVPAARIRAAIEAQSAAKARAKPRATNGADGRSVVAPKYRNPQNPSQTWSGRGEAPDWIEFGSETLPPRKPGGPVRRVPLPKFLIPKDPE